MKCTGMIWRSWVRTPVGRVELGVRSTSVPSRTWTKHKYWYTTFAVFQVLATGRSKASAVGPYPIGNNHVILQLNSSDSDTLKIKPKADGLISAVASQFRSPSDITFSGHMIFPNEDVVEEMPGFEEPWNAIYCLGQWNVT